MAVLADKAALKARLLALWPDNTDGDVSVADGRAVLVDVIDTLLRVVSAGDIETGAVDGAALADGALDRADLYSNGNIPEGALASDVIAQLFTTARQNQLNAIDIRGSLRFQHAGSQRQLRWGGRAGQRHGRGSAGTRARTTRRV